ncbi:MAG: hypothetical protein Q8P20_05330 [bacterium]|nr:hypothetical protein [bacterium]
MFIFKKRVIIYLVILFSFFFNFLNINTVFAANLNDASRNLDTVTDKAGVESMDLGTTAGNLVKGGLGVVGLLFFILVFYGGFSWMIARGNEENVKKARNTVIAAIIGLVVVLASYALTSLLGGIFNK